MKDPHRPYQPPGQHETPKGAVLLAAGALTVLVLTNVAWLIAYSALSQKVYNLQQSAPSPSATPSPSPSPMPVGGLYGSVGFPDNVVPPQQVCAVSVVDASKKYCLDHPGGDYLPFSMTVPAGTYNVYASLKQPQGKFTTSYRAYYDKYVTCGGSTSGCAPALHTQYEQVVVPAGGGVSNVSPTDWYALGAGQ
jgi:hypothetical protein